GKGGGPPRPDRRQRNHAAKAVPPCRAGAQAAPGPRPRSRGVEITPAERAHWTSRFRKRSSKLIQHLAGDINDRFVAVKTKPAFGSIAEPWFDSLSFIPMQIPSLHLVRRNLCAPMNGNTLK